MSDREKQSIGPKDVGAIRLAKDQPPATQMETPTKEQFIEFIDGAKSRQDLLIVADLMSVVGYSPEGLMGQKLRKRMEEFDNG